MLVECHPLIEIIDLINAVDTRMVSLRIEHTANQCEINRLNIVKEKLECEKSRLIEREPIQLYLHEFMD